MTIILKMINMREIPFYVNFGKPNNTFRKPLEFNTFKWKAEEEDMELKSRVSIILARNNIRDGDTFFCLRSVNAPVKRRYIYKDGKIKTISGLDIKPATVKNLLNYYIIRKE